MTDKQTEFPLAHSGWGQVKIEAYIGCLYVEVDLSKVKGLNYSVQTEPFFLRGHCIITPWPHPPTHTLSHVTP